MAEQQKQIVEYATRLDENDKKNDETSRKFSTLLQVSELRIYFYLILLNWKLRSLWYLVKWRH